MTLTTLAGVLAFVALGPSPASASGPSPEEAFANLNAWRESAGIAPVQTLDPAKSAACALHDNYVALNGLTHFEEPGEPGYTSEGAEAGRSSVLAGGSTGLPAETWGLAVFHRDDLLSPRLAVTGFDASQGYECMWAIPAYDEQPPPGPSVLTTYTWPYAGQTSVTTEPYDCGDETPDACELVPGATKLGYPLSVLFDGPWKQPYEVENHVLLSNARLIVSSSGTEVAITPIASCSKFLHCTAEPPYYGGFMGGTKVVLLPDQPLLPYTEYTAEVSGEVYAEDELTGRRGAVPYPFDHIWSFVTGPATVDPVANPVTNPVVIVEPEVRRVTRYARMPALVLHKHGGVVTITAHLEAGKLVAAARRGHHRVRFGSRRRGRIETLTARLTPGHWLVTISLKVASRLSAPRPSKRSVLVG